MRNLIDRLLKAARKYTIMDYAFFKITLASFGIILGAYFSSFFLSHINIIWVIFIVSYLWIGYRTLVKHF